MNTDLKADFSRSVRNTVARFLAQNGFAPLGEAEFRTLAEVLAALGQELGETDGELPDAVVKAGVARVLAVFAPPRPELANLAKQLIKGCFQADHPQCRESYHETDATGRCRRQELAYDLARLSGAHCVDCPHWRGWSPEEHAERLADGWKDGAAAFATHRGVFLPEDFRALRLCTQARG